MAEKEEVKLGKYAQIAKDKGNKQGKNKRPLIAKGKNYEITVNEKK